MNNEKDTLMKKRLLERDFNAANINKKAENLKIIEAFLKIKFQNGTKLPYTSTKSQSNNLKLFILTDLREGNFS